MNNTSFEEIYELFLSKIQDYKIRNLFSVDSNVATDLCQKFLYGAIAKFRSCRKDIKTVNKEIGEFNVTLDITEQEILSNLMVEVWMNRNIMNITEMGLNLNDNDFKHYSEEKNLSGKQAARDEIREITSQEIWHYEFDNNLWRDWAAGNYGI